MKIYTESNRPAYYRVMKYWGKKPHNIWAQLIIENTNEGDVVLDPFAGSGLTFFESIRTKRFPVIFDINPLSSFIVDVYAEQYDEIMINHYLNEIITAVIENETYRSHYLIKCESCQMTTDIYNYVWDHGKIISLAYKCHHCKETIVKPVQNINYDLHSTYEGHLWKPSFDLSKLTSISKTTLEKLGGHDISTLWTGRNFEILLVIYDIIMLLPEPYKKLFLFAFIQSTHLTTKMCAARSKKSKRPLSTSWGRPAYMALNRFMEQNPMIQLTRAFHSNAGLLKALHLFEKEIGMYTVAHSIDSTNVNGIAIQADAKEAKHYPKADFIITDPPYGNIIQYGELSIIWNIWLTNAYPHYTIHLDHEVILNESSTRKQYEQMLTVIFRNCYNSLKDGKTMIFTFNSKDADDWGSLKKVITDSGFTMRDVYLQKNRRASEANVSATKGISISDYYIVLSKEGQHSEAQFSKMDELLRREGVLQHDQK